MPAIIQAFNYSIWKLVNLELIFQLITQKEGPIRV